MLSERKPVEKRGTCNGCNTPINVIPGVKNPETTWKKGAEWHKPCWYNTLPDFVCSVCDVHFPSSESTKFREHWLKAHLPEGEVGETLMYLPDGMINDRNYEQVLKENALLKPARLKTLEIIVNYLDALGVNYFLSDGTLLGAFRDRGKMIDCDIDCDVSIMEKDMAKVLDNAERLPGFLFLFVCFCFCFFLFVFVLVFVFCFILFCFVLHINKIPIKNILEGYLLDATSGGRNWLGNTHIPFDGVGAKKLTLVDVRDYSDVIVETMCPEVDIYTYREVC